MIQNLVHGFNFLGQKKPLKCQFDWEPKPEMQEKSDAQRLPGDWFWWLEDLLTDPKTSLQILNGAFWGWCKTMKFFVEDWIREILDFLGHTWILIKNTQIIPNSSFFHPFWNVEMNNSEFAQGWPFERWLVWSWLVSWFASMYHDEKKARNFQTDWNMWQDGLHKPSTWKMSYEKASVLSNPSR